MSRHAQPRIFVLNGPNLHLLGLREPEIYGRGTLQDIEQICRAEAVAASLELVFLQSNSEHELIETLHEACLDAAGIVINPAAFSYSSYAIRDALAACSCPIVEVHISNIHSRSEPWRSKSLISAVATGVISGLGATGYALAIRYFADLSERDMVKKALLDEDLR